MNREGIIKFNCRILEGNPPDENLIPEINRLRQELFNMDLIGVDPEGIGFGNVSMRINRNEFIITGSQTGSITILKPEHYVIVKKFDFLKNYVECCGLYEASSESLTHAAVYGSVADVLFVAHIHSAVMWTKLLDIVPTTGRNIEYGTPEMAAEICRILKESNSKEKKILCMSGHEDGLIVLGSSVVEVIEIINYHSSF